MAASHFSVLTEMPHWQHHSNSQRHLELLKSCQGVFKSFIYDSHFFQSNARTFGGVVANVPIFAKHWRAGAPALIIFQRPVLGQLKVLEEIISSTQ